MHRKDQAKRLQEASFAEKSRFDMILHSPLARAKETCDALLLSNMIHHRVHLTDENFSHDGSVPVLEHEDLRERRPQELVNASSFEARINRFKAWLAARPEQNIAVVGHKIYFKTIMRAGFTMQNVDVCKCRFDCQAMEFSGAELLFRSPLSIAREDEQTGELPSE